MARPQENVRTIPAREAAAAPRIQWDDTQMKSSYANVCNAVGTREEVVLFFGIGNPSQTADSQITVQLSQRVILSPFAAKRLAGLLSNIVEQYERRFGSLATAGQTPQPMDDGQ